MKKLILVILASYSVFAGKIIDGVYYFDGFSEAQSYLEDQRGYDNIIDAEAGVEEGALYRKVYHFRKMVYESLQDASGVREKPMPAIFIAKGDNSEHVVFHDDEFVGSSNIIILGEDDVNNDEKLSWILAHEMSHYFLNHGKTAQETKDDIVGIVDVEDCITCVEDIIKETPKEDINNYAKFLNEVNLISSMYSERFAGIPLDFYGENQILNKIMMEMLEIGKQTGSAACYEADRSYTNFYSFAWSRFDALSQAFSFDGVDFQTLDNRIVHFKNTAANCFHGREDIFKLAFKRATGVSFNEVKKKFETSGEKIDNATFELYFSTGNPFIRLTNTVIHTANNAHHFASKIKDFRDKRYISSEDHADILANRVAKDLGFGLKGAKDYFLDGTLRIIKEEVPTNN